MAAHRTARLRYPGWLPAGGAHDTVDEDVHAVVAHKPEPAARSSRSATDGVTSLVAKERPVIVTIVEDAGWLTGTTEVIDCPAKRIKAHSSPRKNSNGTERWGGSMAELR